ncbi:hypothetical protein FRC06_008456 [Ceratobasidium sp. 370]|nr:hypothetical protein FRC06_008456 [Ceratobasidium sp. 370]
MGADFANVGLSVQFGVTDLIVTHCQRSGRLARQKGTRGRAVMMVTPNQYKQAQTMCENVKDVLPDDFVEVKAEEDLLGDIEDGLGDMLVEDSAIEDGPGTDARDTSTKRGKTTYRRQRMQADVARFITTQGCRTQVLDEVFGNPSHESCYMNGTCDLCIARRVKAASAKIARSG